jgi:hypothetical protein
MAFTCEGHRVGVFIVAHFQRAMTPPRLTPKRAPTLPFQGRVKSFSPAIAAIAR